jgi:hypothetical protein
MATNARTPAKIVQPAAGRRRSSAVVIDSVARLASMNATWQSRRRYAT